MAVLISPKKLIFVKDNIMTVALVTKCDRHRLPDKAFKTKMNLVNFKSTLLPCYRRIYAVALTVLRDSEDAADAVQETFARLWEHRDSLDSIASPEAYAVTIVKRICIDRMRASRTDGRLDNAPEPLQQPDDIDNRDSVAVLKQIIAQLPPNQQTAIKLSSFGGYSNPEIAEIMNESNENVRQLLSRARKKLKELYTKYEH